MKTGISLWCTQHSRGPAPTASPDRRWKNNLLFWHWKHLSILHTCNNKPKATQEKELAWTFSTGLTLLLSEVWRIWGKWLSLSGLKKIKFLTVSVNTRGKSERLFSFWKCYRTLHVSLENTVIQKVWGQMFHPQTFQLQCSRQRSHSETTLRPLKQRCAPGK